MAHPTFMITPDPFLTAASTRASYIPSIKSRLEHPGLYDGAPEQRAGISRHVTDTTRVSRPYVGHSTKPDSFAFAQVVRSDGTPVELYSNLSDIDVSADNVRLRVNSAGLPAQPDVDQARNKARLDKPNSYAWTDWSLTGIQEQRVEKTQLLETFSGNFLYAYGQKPVVLNLTGQLFNTVEFNWRAVFWKNYDNFFRASRLLAMDARMYLVFDDVLIEGYPLNASASQNAQTDTLLPFSMSFLVTRYVDLSSTKGFLSGKGNYYNQVEATAQIRPGRYMNSTRKSIIDWLPVLGDKWITATAAAAAESDVPGASPDAFTQKFVGESLAAVRRGAFAALSGPANFANYLQATAVQSLRSVLHAGATAAVLEVETALGVSKTGDFESNMGVQRGEVNAWFGYLGTITSSLAAGVGWGSSAIAARGVPAPYFTEGSVEQIVDKMAYAIVPAVATTLRGTVTGKSPDVIATWKPPAYDNRGAQGMQFL
jgi:hypothetical protein